MITFTESTVEDATLSWFGELGYSILAGPEIAPAELLAERDAFSESILTKRLQAALYSLNKGIPHEAIDEALSKITRHEAPSLIANNRAFHRMLVDGVEVEYRRPDGSIAGDRVRPIDFDDPKANDWLAVNQFTVIEGQYNRRPDIVVFVNGLPLAVVELKNAADEDANTLSAFKDIQTYKSQIPSLFLYNAVSVISDGLDTRAGTISADWERFMPWRTIEGEELAPSSMPQLEVLLRGMFDKRRFLDLIRYFIVFEEDESGEVIKKLAGYHQFHAVNKAVEATLHALKLHTLTLNPILRTPTPDPSPKGGGEKDDSAGSVVSTTPSPQPPPDGRGSRNAPSAQAEFEVRGRKKVHRQYRGGYQFAGLVELARELRRKQTTAEEMLWQLLRNRQLLGFKFRRQHQYGDYICDFYCHEAQLVIECDGGVHEPKAAWFHDRNRDEYMMKQGLRVLRFTNDRILNDTENVLKEISAHLPVGTDSSAAIETPQSREAAFSPLPAGEGPGERALVTNKTR